MKGILFFILYSVLVFVAGAHFGTLERAFISQQILEEKIKNIEMYTVSQIRTQNTQIECTATVIDSLFYKVRQLDAKCQSLAKLYHGKE
jgi:hypothetical protein